MKTVIQFTFQKVRHDQENEVHLVISLTAPKIDWQEKRPPVSICLVADVSGSMGGGKLEYAKQSMMKLVDHLQPGDYCGLVTFDQAVYPIYEPSAMTPEKKVELRTRIGDLHTGGSTNLSGGLLQGLEWSNKLDAKNQLIRRVITFTDGCANAGVAVRSPDIVRLLSTSRQNTTVSAFGYGIDADQELMADLAKEGQGNYAFIKNPDDAISAFAKELGGLLSIYAQNIEISVEPHNGHKILEVVSDVDVTDNGGKPVIKLPDILSEEARHVVLQMKLSQQTSALPRDMTVADVKISYDLINEKGEKTRKEVSLKSKIRFVKPGEEQSKPTTEVDAIVGLAQAVKKQLEAESLAKAGNYAAANAVIQSFSLDLNSRGLDKMGAAFGKMKQAYVSEQSYSASSSLRRSAQKGMTRSYGLSGADDDASELIGAMGCEMNNSAQVDVMNSFTSSGDSVNIVIQPPVQPPVIQPIVIQPPIQPPVIQPIVIAPILQPKLKTLDKSRSKRW